MKTLKNRKKIPYARWGPEHRDPPPPQLGSEGGSSTSSESIQWISYAFHYSQVTIHNCNPDSWQTYNIQNHSYKWCHLVNNEALHFCLMLPKWTAASICTDLSMPGVLFYSSPLTYPLRSTPSSAAAADGVRLWCFRYCSLLAAFISGRSSAVCEARSLFTQLVAVYHWRAPGLCPGPAAVHGLRRADWWRHRVFRCQLLPAGNRAQLCE